LEAFQCLILSFTFNLSVRPTISLMVLKPNFAMISRISRAINRSRFSTYSGFPQKFFLKSAFCVAIPTGQVFKLQTLIMTQPRAISGVVANPNSSAPNMAAITTSLPDKSLPSVSKTTLSLNLFKINVWCASASPSSHGSPVFLMLVQGAAPEPPS